MNPKRLLQHFNEIAEAPDAVPPLRRFILDLAVRGKLVEQNPEDETASELLKRIEAEKRRLAETGEIKTQNGLQMPKEDVIEFPLPTGWKSVPLGKVAVCLDFRRVPINNEERVKRIEGKPPGQLFPYYGATQQQGWIDDFIFDEELVLLGEDGVPFFDPLRQKAYVISGKTWVNNHAHVFRGILTSNRFLAHWLNVFDYSGRVAGATRSKLNQSKAIDIPTPIPPLAEQHRIVAKVDKLMAVCDELQAAQQKRERRRDRLVAAVLNRLNNGDGGSEPRNQSEFEESTRFYFKYLPRLATRPEHIQQLRQTILNLAVHGKLVPQDPREGSAMELLNCIQAEKERLEREGKWRGETSVRALNDDGLPFELPPTWAWARFGSITISRDGERIPVSKEERSRRAKIYDYYGASGVIDKIDDFLFDKPLLLIGEDGANLINRSTPIAFIARGKYWVNNHAHVIDGISETFLRFIELHINSIDLKPYVTGTAQPKMNQAKMNSIPIALPPLSEQHRIVAKVDELMGLCDELESRLSSNMVTRHRLLEATLSEAIAPS